MKILYISPENTVGTLNLWKETHNKRGNICNFITLYSSQHQYDPGICLNLPFITSKSWYKIFRNKYYKLFKNKRGDYIEKIGYPPIWEPNTYLEMLYFKLRDWLWHFKVEKIIKEMQLLDYDIYHFEWGLEFYRDARFINRLVKLGKPIICTYHGQDLRTRGVISYIDSVCKLNLTSELDLLKKHPNIKYLFLPYNTYQHKFIIKNNNPIRICHSPTNRYYKGSETIIKICKVLSQRADVEFILIENKSNVEAKNIKQTCDILIDQIYNRGGWGYGMNSVEALSMGLCCVTELTLEYEKFIPDHPFINVTSTTLYTELLGLIKNPKKLVHFKEKGKKWVTKYHDINNVADRLYSFYNENGWIK